MKVLNFKKVAASANDANVEYFVPADEILSLRTEDLNTLKVNLKAVAGTSNDEVGDNITITCETGKAVEVGDAIAELMYGNMALGASPVIDANFSNSNITALILTAV
jgi:hypothetical protein